IQASDGNFYGTAYFGGKVSGWGGIYQVTPGGTESILYYFCSQKDCLDGKNPVGGLVQASDGNLYGTTVAGGASNTGVVFRFTLGRTYTTLHQFHTGEGSSPLAKLIQGSDGLLYGTTSTGGNNGCNCGTIFRVSSTGGVKVLHSFDTTDGASPIGPVMQD